MTPGFVSPQHLLASSSFLSLLICIEFEFYSNCLPTQIQQDAVSRAEETGNYNVDCTGYESGVTSKAIYKGKELTDLMLKLLRFFGFNRAISYGVLARAWSLISGPVTLLIIASRFSKEQQGFYFTISSLLALQIFFELGLITVLAQFASHEFAQLNWGSQGRIEGDPLARRRLLDLLCKATKCFGFAALLLIIVLVPAGLYFLDQGEATNFSWRLPWILAVCGTAGNLLIVPFFAIITGSGDVVTVNHREMLGAIIGSFVCWAVIGFHGGLFAVFAITTGNIMVSCVYLAKEKPELLKLAWQGIFGQQRHAAWYGSISWWGEVWPMQWKIALSWVSGYFIFYLFNPVLFHYHGPVVAGQMGMTLSVSSALLAAGTTWINSKSPEFGKMIAKREWYHLDKMFFRVLLQSIGVAVIGAVVGWGIISYLQANYKIGQRFIPANQAGLLLGAICVHIIINAFAVYLRAHKKEPLMWFSIFVALLQGSVTWYFGMNNGSFGVTAGFFAVSALVTLPLLLIIWRHCRVRWHEG
jgi:hypothetical protein